MPSDPRVRQALAAAAPAIAQFRSAVAATLEELRGQIGALPGDGNGTGQALKFQLGPFADGRVDADRLARLLDAKAPLDGEARGRLDRAAAGLREIAAFADDTFVIDVTNGADLLAVVRDRLFHLSAWSTPARRLTPPLIVTVKGSDLRAAGLAELLDGTQKLLLIVEGECAPAPLVRLITPGVFVAQGHDVAELEPLWAWPGTGIGAVVAPTAARFVHDPSAGPEVWQRLKVASAAPKPKSRVGALSAVQQFEELRQLESLAQPPAARDRSQPGTAEPAAPVDPVDRLAAWLLQQADLPERAGGN